RSARSQSVTRGVTDMNPEPVVGGRSSVVETVEKCHNAPRNRQRRNPMSLVITDEILQSARMSATELSQEIAVLLFQREKLTLGQASRLASMSQLQFQHLLASR